MPRASLPAGLGAVLLAAATLTGADDAVPRVPTIDDLLAVRTIRGATISPDGRFVAYAVREADLTQDAYLTRLWLVRTAGGEAFPLTQAGKTTGSAAWSPDGRWLAFLSPREGDKDQLFVISPDGGEALRLTKSETEVAGFAWSDDGETIAFVADEAEEPALKDRKEHLGDYQVVHRDYAFRHLFTLDVAEALKGPVSGKQRTRGAGFSVFGDFSWSPDGTQIAFSATKNPDLVQGVTADLYLLKMADDTVTPLVSQAGPDTDPRWSPDGTQIAFASQMGKTRYYASNSRIALVSAAGGAPRSLTDAFDEDADLVAWNKGGIFFSAAQKTALHLFRLDPRTGAITRVSRPDDLVGFSFSLSRDGKQVAYAAPSPTSLAEVFVSPASPFAPRKLTEMTAQTKGFTLGSRELVSWKSQDGTVIEGVLIKPAGFDPAKKHPLLLVIHGGPTGVDRPTLLDTAYYPSDIWAGRDALVLKVNYRGSAGYGEKFRQLNWRNLGVGDAWDVLSGVDYLIGKGWVDPQRIGCMGWSQGGYISAFLTTSSVRFAAISVGAGISNWATYYYNTDITPFTIQYLGDDPADDPEVYGKTSPMTYVKKAKTPTLIQHGENDRRVPIPNAHELRQGLEDRGVPVEMVVYKGFGHGISKPKAQRAVMRHNLEWFGHYIWGDPLPEWTRPDVPKKDEKTGERLANGSFTADLNGFRIHYEVHGQGPVLMTLPNSWGLSVEGLRALYRPLEERLTLVYFDPRGMGGSGPVREEADRGLAAVRADFQALRAHLKLEKVNAIGWSNGAINLIWLAREHPEALSSAIFVHGMASFGPEEARRIQTEHPELVKGYGEFMAQVGKPELSDAQKTVLQREFWLGAYFPSLFADPTRGKALVAEVFKDAQLSWPHAAQTSREAGTFDARSELAAIPVRSLVIAGAHDLLPPERVKVLADGLPQAKFVVFDKSGHFSQVEEPEAFRAAVYAFLGVAPGARATP